jgi:1-acyl-sn-glycerol-3-phosphate acyltransferase
MSPLQMRSGGHDAPSPPAGRPWQYLLTGARCDARACGLREHGTSSRSSHQAQLAVSILARSVVSILRTRFDFSLSGGLPPSGCVLVSHHGSYWDGVAVAALDPRVVPITSRWWRSIPGVGWVLDTYGVLWTGDETIVSAISMVRQGAACWIAPHGYDHGASRTSTHLGAARICVGAGAPLVPVILKGLSRGTRSRRPRSSAAIAIGQPIWPDARESPAAFSARLEATLPQAAY